MEDEADAKSTAETRVKNRMIEDISVAPKSGLRGFNETNDIKQVFLVKNFTKSIFPRKINASDGPQELRRSSLLCDDSKAQIAAPRAA